MADSRPSTADEKSVASPAAANKLKGFFSKKKPSTTIDDNIDEKGGDITTEVKPTVPEVPPISFSQLFRSVELLCASEFNIYSLIRYSTRFELCVDAVGLVAAAAAGAAQVCSDFFGPREVLNGLFFSP
jgi:ATP-binding cassette, subfamily B (MDR/TAP), member 1